MNRDTQEIMRDELTDLFHKSRGVGGAKEIYTYKLYKVWFQFETADAISDAYIRAGLDNDDFHEYTLEELVNLQAMSDRLKEFNTDAFVHMGAIEMCVDKFADVMLEMRIPATRETLKAYRERLILETRDAIKREENILYSISNTYVFQTHAKLVERIKSFVTNVCIVIEDSRNFGERETCDIRESNKRSLAITNFRQMLLRIMYGGNDKLYNLFDDFTISFMWEPISHYVWGGYQLRDEKDDIKVSIARALKCSNFNKKEND